MREVIYFNERRRTSDELFRLHFEGHKLEPSRLAALFNWLATFCTTDSPFGQEEPKKREVRTLVNPGRWYE